MSICVKVDPVVDAAAKASGLDIAEIKSYLPAGLTIWIDPREVSCRLTENGPLQVIYRAGSAVGALSDTTPHGARRGLAGSDGEEVTAGDGELQRLGSVYNSFTAGGARQQDVVVGGPSPGWSSAGGGGASPVAGGGTSRVLPPPPPTTTTCFTAATFAQTKFGSTKMKSQGPQRPSRLSPTETPPLPAGLPTRLSPSSAAPLSACWGLNPTGGLSPTVNRLSPMQHNPSAQFGMMAVAGGNGDGRLASLQEWILLQQHHHQQQQMQYLAALKQQQQQRVMSSTGHRPLAAVPSSTSIRLASPHLPDASSSSMRQQQLQLPQLQQPAATAQQLTHGSASPPDVVGMFPPLTHDSFGMVDPAVKDDGVHLPQPPADCVNWGFDAAVSGYATGLQQLLLAT